MTLPLADKRLAFDGDGLIGEVAPFGGGLDRRRLLVTRLPPLGSHPWGRRHLREKVANQRNALAARHRQGTKRAAVPVEPLRLQRNQRLCADCRECALGIAGGEARRISV